MKADHRSTRAMWLAAAALLLSGSALAERITVYKSPTCGCCGKWVDYMKDKGYEVDTVLRPNMQPIKRQFGIAQNIQSCHTAVIGDYIIEGHVPAEDIARLMAEKPPIKILTAPGMPMGSPGMEGPRKDQYRVYAVTEDGKASIWAEH